MTLLLLWNIKGDILRNVLVFGDQVNGHQNRLVINILQNVFFCVLQKNNIWVSDLTKKEVKFTFLFYLVCVYFTGFSMDCCR